MGHGPCFSFSRVFQPSTLSVELTRCTEVLCDSPHKVFPGPWFQEDSLVKRLNLLVSTVFLSHCSMILVGQNSADALVLDHSHLHSTQVEVRALGDP